MPVSSAPRPGSGMSSGEVPRESPDPTTTSRAPHPHRHRASRRLAGCLPTPLVRVRREGARFRACDDRYRVSLRDRSPCVWGRERHARLGTNRPVTVTLTLCLVPRSGRQQFPTAHAHRSTSSPPPTSAVDRYSVQRMTVAAATTPGARHPPRIRNFAKITFLNLEIR